MPKEGALAIHSPKSNRFNMLQRCNDSNACKRRQSKTPMHQIPTLSATLVKCFPIPKTTVP